MAQPRGSEDHRVVIELSEVFARLLRERPGAARGEGHAALVGASRVRGQITAAVGGADFEPGIAIERSLKDQVRQGDRRFEWIADHILEHAVALEPAGGPELV